MNAGMHGMADGRGMAGRKLIRQLRSEPSPTETVGSYVPSILTAVTNVGASYLTLASVTGGVDTVVFSLTGRGAVRWLGIGDGAASNSILTRLVIDGQTVISGAKTSKASPAGIVLCGFGYGSSATGVGSWDYMPFDSSVQVFYQTSSTASPYLGYVIDLHQ